MFLLTKVYFNIISFTQNNVLNAMGKLSKYFLLIIFIIPSKNVFAQANDTEAALYNIGFGGVSCAIGAVINKKADEKFGKVFLKGFWQGALGGYVTFESKRVLRFTNTQDDWKLYWTSNLINSAGNSIKENAANNKDFWVQWNFSIGFNRIEFHTKDKFYMRYKVMPITAVYTLDAFFRYKFDVSNSLKSGHLIFEQNRSDFNHNANASAGYIVFNTSKIGLDKEIYNRTLTHEITHLYQAEDFLLFNSYYNKQADNLFKNSNFMQNINKYIYYDLHLALLRAVYGIEYYKAKEYYDNYFEHEAGYYSNTLYRNY